MRSVLSSLLLLVLGMVFAFCVNFSPPTKETKVEQAKTAICAMCAQVACDDITFVCPGAYCHVTDILNDKLPSTPMHARNLCDVKRNAYRNDRTVSRAMLACSEESNPVNAFASSPRYLIPYSKRRL